MADNLYNEKMPVIHYHPGYRVDLSSPQGDIIQILNYGLMDNFRGDE